MYTTFINVFSFLYLEFSSILIGSEIPNLRRWPHGPDKIAFPVRALPFTYVGGLATCHVRPRTWSQFSKQKRFAFGAASPSLGSGSSSSNTTTTFAAIRRRAKPSQIQFDSNAIPFHVIIFCFCLYFLAFVVVVFFFGILECTDHVRGFQVPRRFSWIRISIFLKINK